MAKKSFSNKILVALILFTMLFSNYSYTFAAVASSEEFKVISNGIFKKDEIKLKASMLDSEGKESSKLITDVNKKAKLVIEVTPQVEGVLKTGYIRFVPEKDEKLNFKIVRVAKDELEEIPEPETVEQETTKTEEVKNETTKTEIIRKDTTKTENKTQDTDVNNIENTTVENLVTENTTVENTVVPYTDNTEENNNTTPNISEDFENNTLSNTTSDTEKIFKSNTNSILTDTQSKESAIVDVEDEIDQNEIVEETEATEEKEISEEKEAVEDDEKVEEITEEKTEEKVEEKAEEIVEEVKEETEEKVKEIEEPKEEEIVPVQPEDVSNEMVDEEKIIEDKTNEAIEAEKENQKGALSEIYAVSDNEIEINYLKAKTKIVVEIEFVKNEKFVEKELLQKVKVQLGGKFVNEKLEEVDIGKEEKVTVGWSYSNDFSLQSEYTKLSPFEVGTVKGTILENRVVVSRKEEKNFLPVKSLNLEIEVPVIDDKEPTAVNVSATRLLASRGEDVGEVNFSKDNWKYDNNSKKIVINIDSQAEENNKYSVGDDEFIIIFRYESYISGTNTIEKKVKASLEEYSNPKNNTLKKELDETQEIVAAEGEVVSYTADVTDDKISKAKIYANYNSDEENYEVEFKTQYSLSILTSDILEKLEVNSTKEYYRDINETIYETSDVKMKQINFKYSEVIALLEKGGDITIKDGLGDILYVLTYQTINSEEDVNIRLNNAKGLIITANNIANNGIINFEVIKAISKSEYDKPIFRNFKELESVITATAQYSQIEETVNLAEIKTKKLFEEANTIANLYLSQNVFSTLKLNDNLELKIVLNNNRENSDLYIDPSFEIVFPKYITDISLESVNLLYEEGLVVSSATIDKVDEISKIKIDLIGAQSRFVENDFINGTTIIINASIEVDDYAPSKEDKIKLYYFNSGATNYQTQTVWSIDREVPENVLKAANGFDVAIIKYQAPDGLVLANEMINYDGVGSKITSIKQGPKEVKIERKGNTKLVTMELLAFNNTGSECEEVVFVGRIPFKGNKDVITKEDLGTTTNVEMLNLIKEDPDNKYISTIYYSEKEDATSIISNGANQWQEIPDSISNVKSFLIKINGIMEPGTVLKYTYEFELPDELPYDVSIAGSFGGYYCRKIDNKIINESSSAEKVALITGSGVRADVYMSVDVGEGTPVKGFEQLKYTINVVNSGNFALHDLNINGIIPTYTNLTEISEYKNVGDAGYVTKLEDKVVVFTIEELLPDESKEFSYYVTTRNGGIANASADGYDENGYYINKENEDGEIVREYLEGKKQYIESKATVTSLELANTVESNTVVNELLEADFEANITDDAGPYTIANQKETVGLYLRNASGRDLKGVKAILYVGDIFDLDAVLVNDSQVRCSKNEKNNTITINIGDLRDKEYRDIKVRVVGKVLRGEEISDNIYFEIQANDVETCFTKSIDKKLITSILEAKDVSFNIPEVMNEEDEIVLSTQITNKGSFTASQAYLECNIPSSMNIKYISYNGEFGLSSGSEPGKIYAHIPNMQPGETINIDIKFKAQNNSGKDDAIAAIDRVIHNYNQNDINLEQQIITIKNNLKTQKEYEEERDRVILEKYLYDADNTDDELEDEEYYESEDELEYYEQEPEYELDNYENIEENTEDNTEYFDIDELVSRENEDTEEIEPINEAQLNRVSGKIWFDENNNNALDDNEIGIPGVNVYLYTADNVMMKSTVTDLNGEYRFNKVENGDFSIGYNYDDQNYKLTTYKKLGVEEDKASNGITVESEIVNATTNKFKSSNTKNMNLGLQARDKFDIVLNEYLSHARIITKENVTEYDFDESEFSKIEIPKKYIDNAEVELEYTIKVENIGNVSGYAEKIVSYLENGMTFDEDKNEGWFIGENGITSTSLSNVMLNPGDVKELKLVLSKKINKENTGIFQNKVTLEKAFNQANIVEESSNNLSTASTFITVETGKAKYAYPIVIIVFIVASVVYLTKKQVIDLSKLMEFKDKIHISKPKINIFKIEKFKMKKESNKKVKSKNKKIYK